jgi:hypothetical protein
VSPRAREDTVRPRLQSGGGSRPLNFSVRRTARRPVLPEYQQSSTVICLMGFALMGVGFMLDAVGGQHFFGRSIWVTGLGVFVVGCSVYAKGKGRSPYWGLAGIIFPFGFLVVCFLADRYGADETTTGGGQGRTSNNRWRGP